MSESYDNIVGKVIGLTENYHFSIKQNIYRETLRQLLSIFGNIYYLDGTGGRVKVKCTTGKPDRPTGKDENENNLILPYITVTEIGSEESDERRRVNSLLVNEKIWDEKENRAKRYLSLAPKAINISYQINIWAKYNADLDQIRYAIFTLFNPSLDIRTKFSDYTKAFVKSETDINSQQAGDTTDRLVQKSITISVETYLPSPKFLFTNTGEIKSLNAEIILKDTRQEATEQVTDIGLGGDVIENDGSGGGGGGGIIGPLTLSGSLEDVSIINVGVGQVLAWDGSNWVASSISVEGGSGDHQNLTLASRLNSAAHPQYASSSVSAYAFGLSSILESHIASASVHFTSGSLSSYYASIDWVNENFASSSVSSQINYVSSYVSSVSSIVSSHINDYTIHFTSGSLSGAYVLTSTNSNLSSLVSNIETSTIGISSTVHSHIGSAVHWELSTLNTNYLNASGDSANAGFYLSSVSATDISATNYYNLPSATIVWRQAQDIVLTVRNETGSTLTIGTPVTISGIQGDVPIVHVLSSVNTHVPEAYGFSNHVAGLVQTSIDHNQNGLIVVEGIIESTAGYNFNTAAFNAGDFLYVSSNGRLSNQRPPAPYESHPVGIVLRAHPNAGKILVKIENVSELNDIVGFNLASSLIDGDLISYDYSTSTFRNKQSISLSGTIKAPTLSGTVVSAGTLHVGGSDGIIKNNNGDIIISATNGIIRFPYGLSAASVSTTTYAGLPSSTALWNANKLQGRDVLDQIPSTGQVLTWNVNRWEPSTVSTGGGGGVTDHGALTGLLDNDHPQYASSSVSAQINSVSAYASGVSSIVSSHINDSSIHFTSGSLSGAYVLTSVNSILSSLVSNIQTSSNNLSGVVGAHIGSAVHWDLATLNTNYINASGDSASALFYFSSLSATTLNFASSNSNTVTFISGLVLSTQTAPLIRIGTTAGSEFFRLTARSDNIHIGFQSGFSQGAGTGNTSLGYNAAISNATGTGNTVVGYQSNPYNTASYNTALGASVLASNTSGTFNTGVGAESLYYTSGSRNVAVGYRAGYGFSGTGSLTPNNNIVIGFSSNATTTPITYSNTIVIGSGIISTADNETIIGHPSTSSTIIRGALSATSYLNLPVSSHSQLTNLTANDHPQYASSAVSAQINSVSAYASGVSSIVSSHINDSTIHFTSGSLSGAYVLITTNQALSSLVSNVQTSSNNLSGVVGSHIASAVHWDLATLNTNYLNSSGDSANASFYLSNLSGINFSATNYLNLPTSSLSGLADVSITNPTNGQSLIWSSTISRWVPSSVAGGGGGSTAFGSNYQLQFYNGGSLSAVSNMTYNPTSQNLDVYKVNVTDSMYSPYYNGGFGSLNNTGLQANQVSATTYLNLPYGTALWNANKLQGYNISSTAPRATSGQNLIYDGGGWKPGYVLFLSADAPNNTIGADGDIYIQSVAPALSGLSDTTVTSTPSTGQLLAWNSTKWVPSSIVTGSTAFGGFANPANEIQFYNNGNLSSVSGFIYHPSLFGGRIVVSSPLAGMNVYGSLYGNYLEGGSLTVYGATTQYLVVGPASSLSSNAFLAPSISATTISATTYRNLPTSSLSGLADTLITSPALSSVLKWNGSKWVAAPDATGTGGGINNAFTYITDSLANTVQGTGEDTIKFVSRDNTISITADNTAGPPQEVNFEVDETAVVHNNLFGLTTGNPHTQYATLSGAVFSGQLLASSLSAITYQNLPSGTATWNANKIQGVDVSAFNNSTVRIASSLLLPSALIFGSGIPSTAQFPAGIYYTAQSAQNAPPAIYQCNQDNLNIYTNFGQGKAFRLVDQVAAAGGFAGSGYEFDGNSFVIQHGANTSATLVVPSNGVLQVQNTLSATTVSAINYFGLPSQLVAASSTSSAYSINTVVPGALLFSRTIDGISAGDIIDFEIWGNINNNTGGNITASGVYQLGTLSGILADGTTIGTGTSALLHSKGSISVPTTNFCALNVIQNRATAAANATGAAVATGTPRYIYTVANTNLTGSQTFNFRIASTATANQTFTIFNYKITKTKTL